MSFVGFMGTKRALKNPNGLPEIGPLRGSNVLQEIPSLMESSQTHRNQSTASSTMEDEHFSIDSLLERIDEFQNRSQLETIYCLSRENESLKEQINKYKETRTRIAHILRETYETMLLLEGTLAGYGHETAMAGRDWLAFWGVYSEPKGNLSTTTWI